jgi:putative endonuclease
MASVYILQSCRDGRFYIGSTVDLRLRLKHHYGGFTPSTKRFGKLRLVFVQEYPTLKEARYTEYRLKQLKRRDYIEKIIKDGFVKIKNNGRVAQSVRARH